MMHGSPKHAGRVIEIAVGLNIDDDASATLRRESSADGSRSAVAHAACALATEISVRFVVIPQSVVMTARETTRRREAPVFVHDQRPEFGIDASCADWAAIPSRASRFDCLSERFDAGFLIGFGVFRNP